MAGFNGGIFSADKYEMSKQIDDLFDSRGISKITLIDSKNKENQLTLTKDEFKAYLGIFEDMDFSHYYSKGDVFKW